MQGTHPKEAKNINTPLNIFFRQRHELSLKSAVTQSKAIYLSTKFSSPKEAKMQVKLLTIWKNGECTTWRNRGHSSLQKYRCYRCSSPLISVGWVWQVLCSIVAIICALLCYTVDAWPELFLSLPRKTVFNIMQWFPKFLASGPTFFNDTVSVPN